MAKMPQSDPRVMKDTVMGGRCLCEEHITLAQAILHDQFTNIEGFQSPLLCQKDAFIPVKNGQAIQIHHINEIHWCTSCTIDGEVVVFDGDFSGGALSTSLTHQLALIYHAFVEKVYKKQIALNTS